MSAREVLEARVCVPLSLARSSWQHEEPVTVGMPFPRGVVETTENLVVAADEEVTLPTQVEPLASWPDGTVRWALVDFLVPSAEGEPPRLSLRGDLDAARTSGPPLDIDESDSRIEVATGGFRFVMHGAGSTLLDATCFTEPESRSSCDAFLVDRKGRRSRAEIRSVQVVSRGPVRSTTKLSLELPSQAAERGKPRCQFSAWVHLYAGSGLVKIDFVVRNPRAAEHPGGLWDLGDPASVFLRDLGLRWGFADGRSSRSRWWLQPERGEELTGSGSVEIAQGASGGANWKSVNHVDHRGEVLLPFRGYRLRSDSHEEEGSRCHPVVAIETSSCRVSSAVHQFWQQFPNALEAGPNGLEVRLFPTWGEETHELQGGEQKRHTVYFLIAPSAGDGGANPLAWVRRPAAVTLPPRCFEETGVFQSFLPKEDEPEDELSALIDRAVEGDTSFFAKRETADEYGWRHFGEVYADHEETHYRGAGPLVSHYNNQYDLLYGFLRQGARTGDARWFELGADLARHVIDIDIYHTEDDHPLYSHGLFWHTDHYLSAARATHRCYSRDNAPTDNPSSYGGGPSNEHCYTTGLLYYYYLTGDPLAREAVTDLVEWVISMDDGTKTILGQLDDGPTGLASQSAGRGYHGPGRGAGNAINALLDGFRLLGRRRYLEKAEELIRRCIHPEDCPSAMDFENIELRWSYLVFLQTLGRYLDLKVEQNDEDERFGYARACLDRYSRWMLEHEKPYSEVLDRVEYPTETWPAHDFRKSAIFDWASRYGEPAMSDKYREKAEEYFVAATRGLTAFETCGTTRPLAICLSLSGVRAYCARVDPCPSELPEMPRHFGPPVAFVSQKERVKSLARSPRGLLRIVLFLLKPGNLAKLIARRIW